MSSCRKAALLAAAALWAGAVSAQVLPGIGRAATPSEIAAWDIDVRPDFKGLPKGSGSVAQGQDIWEAKCASCHGVFGESNQFFAPLTGGTTADDLKTGRAARLRDPAFPGRTTMMKLSTVSTLWDYINRAMPWNAPKSLSTNEVYAVTAYVLNLGGVLPDDFVLSDGSMAAAQARLPNRNGMSSDHGLWPGRGLGNGGKPDVKAVACMSNCATEAGVASMLPDHARNAHGNLAEQNRPVGAQRGADTSQAPGTAPGSSAAAAARAAAAAAPAASKPGGDGPDVAALLAKYACSACHGPDSRLIGPSWREVVGKHGQRPDAAAYLAAKIRSGGSGDWGPVPMPPQTLPDADLQAIARWLAEGARK